MFEGYAVTIEKQALKAIIYGSQISDDDQDAISLVLRNDYTIIMLRNTTA